MAIAALTGARDHAPTGISPTMSRRELILAASVATAAVAIAVPVIASAEIEDPGEAQRQAFLATVARDHRAENDKFWRLYDGAQRIESEFNARQRQEGEDEDAVSGAFAERSVAAINAALLCGVFSAAAVHAKLKLTDFDPGAWELPGIAKNAAQMIAWDLERIAKREWVERG
ncbi:hypothetical protein [Novosphingobium sp. Fuku2-ISO-50]|uniref:hypothetical protein n=1 Tax=Novosphingobium sp. Fuku2-ISO-50 TaxID=1739114 RepID=UPI000AF9ABDE|nr:hypothetical protein [Novosphingobium sp. Fuku2-ISO-50]